ncbi:hypothetical protein HYV88_01130 [Candidatus Woesearchaeota archaeon]|nr:hypothetical protein [Candidatus Woesearchaeota archaeon]
MVNQYNVIVIDRVRDELDREQLGTIMCYMQRFMPTRHGNPYRWREHIQNIPHVGEALVIKCLDQDTAENTGSELRGLVERMSAERVNFDNILVIGPKVTECEDPVGMQKPIGKMVAVLRLR